MPFSTSRAAVSRCLLALALLLSLLMICGAVTTSADAARKRPAAAKKSSSNERFTVQKQRGKAGRWQGPASGRSALRGTTMGINAGGALFTPDAGADAQRLGAIAQAGARVIRFDASWSGLEPSAPLPGQEPVRRFASLDRPVLAATRAGLRPLLMLGYGTPWATPDGHLFTTPSDPQTYARFVAAVASRYAPGSTFWRGAGVAAPAGGVLYEIWNEPNGETFLRGQETAATRYAELLLLAQRAIRAADPQARVSTGGLVPITAARFLADVLRAQPELRNEIRAIGWHPYERSAQAVVRITRQFRKNVDALGLAHLPLDITEFGWSELELAEPVRSQALEQALVELRDPSLGVGLLLPYVAMDRPGATSYGLWRTTGEATQSVAAYTRVALRSNRPRASARHHVGR